MHRSSMPHMQGHTHSPISTHSLCCGVHDPLDTAKPDLPPSPVLAVATSDAKLRVRTAPPPSIWGFAYNIAVTA